MKEQDAAHSMTMKIFLLPCPFCGSEPEWINESLSDDHFYIRCPHCHIVMKEDRRDKAIGMWNRRAELTRLRSELQQERELRKELVEVLSFYYSHGYIHGTGYEGENEIESLIKKAKLNN